MRPLVVDTFMFNGHPDGPELDLLECRLEEMDSAVDFWVAVEADVDHQDHPKPYYLTEHLDRYAAWKDKLIVVQATGLPTHADDPDPWARELAQREHAITGIEIIANRLGDNMPTADDVIVLHGDVDEICRPLFVKNLRLKPLELVTLEQDGHFHAVDWLHPDPWGGTVACAARTLGTVGPDPFQKVRNVRNGLRPGAPSHYKWRSMLGAGWHFSWLGGQQASLNKLGSFCHPEVADRTLVGLTSDMYLREGLHLDGRRMTPVEVDHTWPKYIHERRCPPGWFRPR